MTTYNFPLKLSTEKEMDFAVDNQGALPRLISILTELQSGVVTLDLQNGVLVAANVTKREHFVG